MSGHRRFENQRPGEWQPHDRRRPDDNDNNNRYHSARNYNNNCNSNRNQWHGQWRRPHDDKPPHVSYQFLHFFWNLDRLSVTLILFRFFSLPCCRTDCAVIAAPIIPKPPRIKRRWINTVSKNVVALTWVEETYHSDRQAMHQQHNPQNRKAAARDIN